MNDPKKISISDYNYTLPEERIAKYPSEKREEAKLLVVKGGHFSIHHYSELPGLIRPDDHFFYNNTRVIHARLIFTKDTGGEIEIFLLAPSEGEHHFNSALAARNKVRWKCFIGGARKWKSEAIRRKIRIGDDEIILSAVKTGNEKGVFEVDFEWDPPGISFSEILEFAGQIPLPPYFNRNADENDLVRYQTVYSTAEGSVAAPTAGLHFTSGLLKQMESVGCTNHYITLHVGAGTFKPVSSEHVGDHAMHSEYFEISADIIRAIAGFTSGRIIPVGTTTMRTLESLYWLGEKYRRNLVSGDAVIEQWDGFMTGETGSLKENLNLILVMMEKRNMETLCARTSMIIAPGYKFRIANGLVTNFHMPQSTLLLLVAALAGEQWKQVYEFALQNDFRFLSYGDGMMIVP